MTLSFRPNNDSKFGAITAIMISLSIKDSIKVWFKDFHVISLQFLFNYFCFNSIFIKIDI